jgi:hypothetical protein
MTVTVTRRQIAHALGMYDRRPHPVMWPYVDSGDVGLKCFGDQHRSELQIGADTSHSHAVTPAKQIRRDAEATVKAETARLVAWLTANTKAIPKVFTIGDIIPLVAPDVFLDTSNPMRRQLMVARALRSGGFIKTANSKTACWCRSADLKSVTRIGKSGRTMLTVIPASLLPRRAQVRARQIASKARRPIVGTMAAIEKADAATAYENDQARIRMQRYRDRKAARRAQGCQRAPSVRRQGWSAPQGPESGEMA